MKINWSRVWRKHSAMIEKNAAGPRKNDYWHAYLWEGDKGQSKALLNVLRGEGLKINWYQWRGFNKLFVKWYDKELYISWRSQQKFIRDYFNKMLKRGAITFAK